MPEATWGTYRRIVSAYRHPDHRASKKALHYVTQPCNGIPGILTPVKTGTPRNQRTSAPTGPTVGHHARAGQGPLYRLADYLDQHGRHHRAETIPPLTSGPRPPPTPTPPT